MDATCNGKMSRQQKRGIREKARRCMSVLLWQHGHSCFWCNRLLVITDRIPSRMVEKLTGNTVTWKDGETHNCHFATVDHLHGLKAGNDLGNLVPSCRTCNSTRSNKPRHFLSCFPQHLPFVKINDNKPLRLKPIRYCPCGHAIGYNTVRCTRCEPVVLVDFANDLTEMYLAGKSLRDMARMLKLCTETTRLHLARVVRKWDLDTILGVDLKRWEE